MASGYRKRKGVEHDTWHFCSNCSNWPTADYVSRDTEPSDGEKCDECRAKRKSGDCS